MLFLVPVPVLGSDATDPQLVASMFQGAMLGVSRRMLASSVPEKELETLRPAQV
jgi:hypothetical protein